MKKALFLMIVLVITGMTVLFSCGKSGNYVTGPSNSNPTVTGTYRISGDSIYVALSDSVDTSRYCNGNSLELNFDTTKESGIPYSISNNTLTLTTTDSSMNGAGYTIGMVMTFSRVGMGGGVEGTWNFTSESYTILTGTAPDSIRQEINSMNTMISQMIASGKMSEQYIFSGNQFTATSSYTYPWADDYVMNWTRCNSFYGTDTCSYFITVVKLTSSMVQLHGKTTGETVTISFSAAGDETFKSSDPTHLAYTYYMNPVQCPNNYEPDWFPTFLNANAKPGTPLYKKSVQHVTVPKKPSLSIWPRVF
jgi:hypothetical protein